MDRQGPPAQRLVSLNRIRCWAPLSVVMLALLWVVSEGWGTEEEVSGSEGRGAGP
jgi:hypothetical protein